MYVIFWAAFYCEVSESQEEIDHEYVFFTQLYLGRQSMVTEHSILYSGLHLTVKSLKVKKKLTMHNEYVSFTQFYLGRQPMMTEHSISMYVIF